MKEEIEPFPRAPIDLHGRINAATIDGDCYGSSTLYPAGLSSVIAEDVMDENAHGGAASLGLHR